MVRPLQRALLVVVGLGLGCGSAPAPVEEVSGTPAAEPEPAFVHPIDAPPARQFDFWVGRWDVQLQARQEDGAWDDLARADVGIYSVLGGNAVLELWDSTTIEGFSFRYWDPDAQVWRLWLNWPGPKGTRLGYLEGAFDHGRGVFFLHARTGDGEPLIGRYTFSDITPTSLRWNDGYSTDGGATWREKWVMRFRRTAARARWPGEGERLLTQHDGGRCSGAGYEHIARLVGAWRGELSMKGGGRAAIEGVVAPILDDCAVIGFWRTESAGEVERAFTMLTVDSATGDVLAARFAAPRTGMVLYRGPPADTLALVAAEGDEPGERPEGAERITWTRRGSELALVRAREGADGWRTVAEATLTPATDLTIARLAR